MLFRPSLQLRTSRTVNVLHRTNTASGNLIGRHCQQHRPIETLMSHIQSTVKYKASETNWSEVFDITNIVS